MEDKEKLAFLQIRISAAQKDQFMTLCNKKAINSSKLIRQLIQQWINEQLDNELEHKRKTDI